jgi:nucleotide-binding universal stress UspA family protein
MYVEDIDLVRTAELPFACVISSSGQPRPLTPETVQRQLARHADMARNAVEAAGARCHLTWSFFVVRGNVDREIAQAGSAADFVAVGRSGWSGSRARHLGSVTRSLAAAGTTSLLVVGERGLREPVAVLCDGGPSSDRAMAFAAELSGNDIPVTIFLLQTAPSEELKRQARQVKIIPVDSGSLLDSIRKSGSRTIVIPSTSLSRFRELTALLDDGDLSVLLVK